MGDQLTEVGLETQETQIKRSLNVDLGGLVPLDGSTSNFDTCSGRPMISTSFHNQYQLFPFLRDNNPDVRKLAVQHVLSFTRDGPSLPVFRRNSNRVFSDLAHLVQDHPLVANDAISCLINLSAADVGSERWGDEELMLYLVDVILVGSSVRRWGGRRERLLLNMPISCAVSASYGVGYRFVRLTLADPKCHLGGPLLHASLQPRQDPTSKTPLTTSDDGLGPKASTARRCLCQRRRQEME